MKCLNRQGVVVLCWKSRCRLHNAYVPLQAQSVFVIDAADRFRQSLDLSVMIRALVDPVSLALLCCPERMETPVPSRPQTKPAAYCTNGYQS